MHSQHLAFNRIAALIARRIILEKTLIKWSKADIWILSRFDLDYPQALTHKLKEQAPPILFGAGNRLLLVNKCIAVVGSREAEAADLKIAQELGHEICNQNLSVVSGAARGVDEAAMFGALEAGGNCLGIIADSLLKRAGSLKYKKYIESEQLILLSVCDPEAIFSAMNAMIRNRLIYAMSQAAIVVRSDTKGGTWEGASECLKRSWVPLFVCRSLLAGNRSLVILGAHWLEIALGTDFSALANTPVTSTLF